MAGVKGRSGTNKGQEKPFRDALRMEIASAGEDHRKLRAVAKALLDKAESGDVSAIKEIGDRLDGKPAQAIVGDENSGPVKMEITWKSK